jgi:hypothetical protein
MWTRPLDNGIRDGEYDGTSGGKERTQFERVPLIGKVPYDFGFNWVVRVRGLRGHGCWWSHLGGDWEGGRRG